MIEGDCVLDLVMTGQVVDRLLNVTNPGLWMAHCQIAEHIQGGIMFSFTVSPGQDEGPSAFAGPVMP